MVRGRRSRATAGASWMTPTSGWPTALHPGRIYEVVYRTQRCPVVGAGLLATRDFVSYLRSSSATDNPCAGRITRTFAFGVSQSGRFLRHYLYLGLNVDETGQTGLRRHAAARRGRSQR